jgi:hypothetical protein
MPNVFRWNIARREQLGRLIDGEPAADITHLLAHVRSCSARVLAMAGDARLVFVGRSPDALYDYLSGAFIGTSWADRIALLPLSLKGADAEWGTLGFAARAALREQFRELALDPAAIATNALPVTFVDLICDGDTFGSLLDLLFSWSEIDGVHARTVRRRLRIVGITAWGAGYPTPTRWKQLDWARAFRPSALRGVSVSPWFWSCLGNSEAKASRSNPPERWTDPEMAQPPRDARHVLGLRRARALHAAGCTRVERDALAAALSEQPSVRHAWCRVLAAELRAASRPKRIERVFASKQRVRSWKRDARCRTSFKTR